MKFITRWTSTIGASFDWVISQVENHEALVDSAIKEMQQAGAKACAQLKRVEQDGKKMRLKVAELNEQSQTWADRAMRVHNKDRDRALECIRRKKQVERDAASLEQQVVEHSKIEKQLAADLKTINTRISDLKRKKNTLSARQHRAQALQAGSSDDLGIITEIDGIFERWDLKLAQCEAYGSVHDNFEDEFSEEEEQDDLEESLEELIATSQA